LKSLTRISLGSISIGEIDAFWSIFCFERQRRPELARSKSTMPIQFRPSWLGQVLPNAIRDWSRHAFFYAADTVIC
jgi:hypothetical protein